MAKKNQLFQGKVVWITGASSGIGEALAYEFSRLGANLILSARNKENLKKVNANLPENRGKAKVLQLDLEQLDILPHKIREAVSVHGRIDYLINNAGIAIRDYALETALEIDQKLMNINYFGPVVLTKYLIQFMMQQGNGHIVVVSSLSGKYGVPKAAAYSASKHALHGFFETLRSEIDHKNIFITLIVPGIIKTKITANAVMGNGKPFGKVEKSFQKGYPTDKAAKKIIKAILKKKEEAYVGGKEGLTLLINRFSPGLLRKLIRSHPLKKLRNWKNKLTFRKS